jgi:hypothetical protein
MSNAVRVASGLAMAVGVVTACSSPPRTGAAPALAAPVEARILPPFQGMVVFDVNQPAYVAVFDVRPFIGIEMIYPGPNDPGLATGGVQAVTIYHLAQATEERRAMTTPFVGGGEDYLYLVASRSPLHLEEFADHPINLTDAAGVGLQRIGPYQQIDSLMRNVVKPMYDNDWDADVLILTPGSNPSVNGAQLVLDCGTSNASKVCAHSDRVVPTIPLGLTGSPITQGVAAHDAPNGATRPHTAGEEWESEAQGAAKGTAAARAMAKSPAASMSAMSHGTSAASPSMASTSTSTSGGAASGVSAKP